MLFLTITLVLCSTVRTANSYELEARDECDHKFSLCSPKGALSTITPPVGDALSSLFIDLLNSIKSVPKLKRDVQQPSPLLHSRSSQIGLCCADGTNCLLLQGLNLPFCYDKFTTNFLLPGGAFGTIVSGNYTAPNGDLANIQNGDYTLANGVIGNIYGSPSSPSKPDTATLTLPTQYTAAGVGSAIPLTALGKEVTYTTTIPGTTIQPTIISAKIDGPSLSNGVTVVPGTTKPATTIPGTTIPAKTLTVTTTVANASPASKGGASHLIRGDKMFSGAVSVIIMLSTLLGL